MRPSLAALFAALPTLAGAADLDLAWRVDRVTVFPDAAAVTRVAAVSLPSGASTLLLRGLPASIDAASIRVEGAGDARFAIGSVEVRTVPGDAKPALDEALERRLRALRDDRDMLSGRVAAADGKKAAIERYAQAGPEKLSSDAKPLDVGQWQGAWDVIGQGLSAVNDEIRVLKGRVRDLEAEIAALERARPQPARPGAPKRDVAIEVEAAAAGSGEVRVTYRVGGAGWTPVYDGRLDTGGGGRKPSLELVRRAQVSQRTGEDWADVTLSVSTVRVARSAVAPELPPLQVGFYEPPPVVRAPGLQKRAADAAAEVRAEAAPAPAAEVQAEVEAGAFQATFTAPGRVSVPQDGAQKSFALTRRTVQPTLMAVASPALDETAYLQASFLHEEDAPLLEGVVSIQRDGTYVGRSRLRATAPGETVDLGFGADDRIKIARVPVRRRESEPGWIGQTKTDLRNFKITVRNLHSEPMRIAIYDRVPFSENGAITVEQTKETTSPTEKQVGDKRGVMGWTYDYAPRETRDIRVAYRLRWPADREIVLEPKPVGTK